MDEQGRQSRERRRKGAWRGLAAARRERESPTREGRKDGKWTGRRARQHGWGWGGERGREGGVTEFQNNGRDNFSLLTLSWQVLKGERTPLEGMQDLMLLPIRMEFFDKFVD